MLKRTILAAVCLCAMNQLPAAQADRAKGVRIATPERQRTLVGRRAAKLVKQGDVVGLGTGRTASEFIIALGGRIKREGLQITAVSSSTRSTDLAQANGIFVRPIADVAHIDIAVDGADEVDPASDLVKGRGGALLRERQVANKSKRLVIMVDAAKFVPALGKGAIPVEIRQTGAAATQARLAALGKGATLRVNEDGTPFVTDNGNYIVDVAVTPRKLATARRKEAFSKTLLATDGVLDHGLFLGMKPDIISADANGKVMLRPAPRAN